MRWCFSVSIVGNDLAIFPVYAVNIKLYALKCELPKALARATVTYSQLCILTTCRMLFLQLYTSSNMQATKSIYIGPHFRPHCETKFEV